MRQNDKSVPDDLSVIGYDDVEMCRYVTPALTTVAQPIYELGKQAADLMVKRLAVRLARMLSGSCRLN